MHLKKSWSTTDNRLSKIPARGDKVKLPRKVSARRAYLTHEQVEASATASKYPDFVSFLAYTGLRWSEATGLRIAHVDRARRRTEITENAVSVNGHIVVGTPKTHERRTVVFPAFLDEAVEVACKGKKRDALLRGDGVNYLRPGDAVSGWFTGAVKRAQVSDPDFPRVMPHDLRHTAASLAISAGAVALDAARAVTSWLIVRVEGGRSVVSWCSTLTPRSLDLGVFFVWLGSFQAGSMARSRIISPVAGPVRCLIVPMLGPWGVTH